MKTNRTGIRWLGTLLTLTITISQSLLANTGDKYIIIINDADQYEFWEYPTGNNPALPTITMGDKVAFKVYPNDNGATPTIHGLTGMDIMIHGHRGQAMCHPDIQPGQAKPFLPIDARIHGKQILKWPDGQTTLPKWADWATVTEDGVTHYEFTWIANRRMDATKAVYAAEIDFPKYKTFGDREQRASQLFGMQMQMLHFWKERMAANNYSYNNQDNSAYNGVDYLLGIDNDEYVYYNHPGVYEPGNIYFDPNNSNGDPANIFKVRSITENGELYNPWQYIPSTEQKEHTYDSYGYPSGGFELNDIITEYFKYWTNQGETTDPGPYKGYMIEDYNTYEDNGAILYRGPNGDAPRVCAKNGQSNCVVNYMRYLNLDLLPTSSFSQGDTQNGNVKHPGLLKLGTSANSTMSVNIPINVKSPFVRDYGFYGNVKGERMPLIGDVVAYTLVNVDPSLPQSASFKLEWWDYDPVGVQQSGYEPLGGTYKVEKSVSEFEVMDGHADALQAEFSIEVGKYNPFLVVSYSRTGLDEDYVIVGSKMANAITGTGGFNLTSLADRGAPLDDEDTWRTEQYGEYTVPTLKTLGKDRPDVTVYIKEFQKEYTLPTGVTVTAETGGGFWPFAPNSNNYYWTHQKSAQMGRIEEVEGRIRFEIYRLNSDNSQILLKAYSGLKTIAHSFDKAGEYVMSVWMDGETNNWPKTSYKVVVKDEFALESGDLSKHIKRADIEIKPFDNDYLPKSSTLLSDLGLDTNTDWEIAEVTNVLSKYANDIELGPRDIQGKYDRFGDHGGYHAFYKWLKKDSSTVTNAANTWVNGFNELDKWPSSFSTWIRHTNGDEGKDDPANVTDNAVAKYLDNTIGMAIFDEVGDNQYQWPWQRVLEWCETTISKGYRNRTGAKAIFDIEGYLENMMTGRSIDGRFWRGRPDHLADADKDLIELYHDLRTGRKIIFEAGTLGTADNPVEVRNLNPWHESDGNPAEIYMAKYPVNEFIPPLFTASSKEVIKSIEGVGDVSRYIWEGNSTLLGRERIINMAELNFQNDEYQLEIGFMSRDLDTGSPVATAQCKETCTSWPNGRHQGQYCYPEDDQFYTVSVLADRYGAIFATNGTFFDYYQNCLPGLTSYVKDDGFERSYPDYRSMMGAGAFGWNFPANGAPSFGFIEKFDIDSGYEGYKNSINNFAATYSNVMSGGMISTRGNKFKFEMPSYCEAASYDGEPGKIWYPWTNETFEHNGVQMDWTEGTSGDMRSIWCPKVSDDGTGNIALSPHKYSDLMRCESIETNRTLFGCTKNQRYHIKFERPGNTRLGRTFAAFRDGTFYLGTSNGEDEGDPNTNTGFSIDELSQFSQEMDFDWLINLDGGGSAVAFVPGKGVISKITETDKGTEGPMHQRRLQYALMVVPKKHTSQIQEFMHTNNSYLEFDNSGLSESRYDEGWLEQPEVSYLSFGPSLEKLDKVVDHHNAGQGQGGLFATSFKVDQVSDGAVLFSLNEDTHYYLDYNHDTGNDDPKREIRDLKVIGVGKIPPPLRDQLLQYSFNESFAATVQSAIRDLLNTPQYISYYSFTVSGNEIANTVLETNDGNADFYKKYLDGQWHSLVSATYNTIVDESLKYIERVSIDGNRILADNTDHINIASGQGLFTKLPYANHAIAGAINIDGKYIIGNKSKLSLDNLAVAIGSAKAKNLLSAVFPDETSYSDRVDALSSYMAANNNMPVNADSDAWYADDTYLLQMEETNGMHAFGVQQSAGGSDPGFYALKLNGTRKTHKPDGSSGIDWKTALEVASGGVGVMSAVVGIRGAYKYYIKRKIGWQKKEELVEKNDSPKNYERVNENDVDSGPEDEIEIEMESNMDTSKVSTECE